MDTKPSNNSPFVQALELSLKLALMAADVQFPLPVLAAISALAERLLAHVERERLLTPEELKARQLEWRRITSAGHWQVL